MPPKPRKPGGADGGDGTAGKPSQQHGSIDASKGISSAEQATSQVAQAGRPPGSGQQTTPGRQPQPQNPTEPPPGVTFDDRTHPNLGSDGKYYVREGVDHDVPIDEPGNVGRTITDIDRPEGGVLWEEKSAVNAGDVNKWVDKQVTNKIESYIEARQHIAGYEQAPVGIEFTRPGADPAFRAAVENAIADLRIKHPNVTILVEWAQ